MDETKATEANVGMALADLLRQMVVALVDDPAQVHIHGVQDIGGALLLNIAVAEGDVGKLIGKTGRTERSLRTILGGAAAKMGLRCELNIQETKVTRRNFIEPLPSTEDL